MNENLDILRRIARAYVRDKEKVIQLLQQHGSRLTTESDPLQVSAEILDYIVFSPEFRTEYAQLIDQYHYILASTIWSGLMGLANTLIGGKTGYDEGLAAVQQQHNDQLAIYILEEEEDKKQRQMTWYIIIGAVVILGGFGLVMYLRKK